MSESLLSGESFRNISFKKIVDEIFGVRRHISPNLVIECEFAILNVVHDLLLVPSAEWGLTGQDDVHDDSCRPQVALLVVVLLNDLGGDVVRSADHLGDWEIFLFELLGCSEVN